MSNGWIKLHHSIQRSSDWYSEPFTRSQAWVDMLLDTTYKKKTVRIRGIRIDLERGQLAISEREYAARWKWSRGKVRRFLEEMASETVQRIVPKKNNVCTVVTIIKWDEYQGNGTTDSTTNGTTSSTTDGPQTDTTKKVKKGKKDKEQPLGAGVELPIELDADEFRDAWTDWLEYKREIKKPYTSMRGVKSQITRISKWGLGRAVDAIIYSMAQNYDGIYEDKNSEKKTVRRDPQI